MKYFRVIVILVLCGCASCSTDTALSEKAKAYIECDQKRDYECLWSMRTPGFRRTVPLDVFIGKVQPEYEGWDTVELNILGSKLVSSDVGQVVYEIKEIIPHGLYLGGDNVGGRTARFQETMEWWKVDGEWYALSVGFRGRFSLGSGLELSKVPNANSKIKTLESYDGRRHNAD